MSANNPTGVARLPVTFLHVYQSAPRGGVSVRCVCFRRSSGCVVVVPDRFRRGNWPQCRIGGRVKVA